MEPNETPNEKTEKSHPPSLTSCQSSAKEERDGKVAEILEACRWKDLDKLRALATSEGGLVSDNVRNEAWPLLLGQQTHDEKSEKGDTAVEDWRKLPKHRDEDQVELDVNRSFIYYPHNPSPLALSHRKAELSSLITEVLRRHAYLCYFQGYHDICQVFLLVLKPDHRVSVVARLSALRIRDFMLPTLTPALAQLRLIPAILYTVSPKLYLHLSQTQPFFALSGTLTMYAHDIQEYGDIARLFDVFLAREAAFSVYMFAQIVLQRSDELFETPADEPEMLHSILSKLPKPLDLEALISGTVALFEKHPPETLKLWSSISKSSVMKTARCPDQVSNQSLEDGEIYFKHQVKELERAEQREKILKMLWMYQRPARAVGVAIAIGLLAFWIKRSSPSGIFGALWRHLSLYKNRS